MKINQLKSIHHWIRSTETSEIVFVTALILPLYLLLYNTMLNQINPDWKIPGLSIAISLYVIGIIWMKNSQSNEEKKSRDLLIIKNYIIDKGFLFMSFERIQEIDKNLNETRVKELLFSYPSEIRLAKLKGDKKGIKILNIESEDDVI